MPDQPRVTRDVIHIHIARKQLSQGSIKDTEAVAALEMERDFYFSKLREIEMLCQAEDQSELTRKILEILYKTQDGFETPAETY